MLALSLGRAEEIVFADSLQMLLNIAATVDILSLLSSNVSYACSDMRQHMAALFQVGRGRIWNQMLWPQCE